MSTPICGEKNTVSQQTQLFQLEGLLHGTFQEKSFKIFCYRKSLVFKDEIR